MYQKGRGNVIDSSRRLRDEQAAEEQSGEFDAIDFAVKQLARSLETEITYAKGQRLKELRRAKRDLSKIKQRVARAR